MAPLPQTSATSIDYFNKSHPLLRFQSRMSLAMRQKMLNAMPLERGMTVLEVGTTPDEDLADSNFFCKAARDKGCEVWVTSPEDCSAMAAKNGLNWLPFAEFIKGSRQQRTFDFSISSAVIEHVGASDEDKRTHLRLLNEVTSHYVAITTPNRFHWLEFHTKLPFIHWLPKPAHRMLLKRLGLRSWADPNHLDLLDRRQLERFAADVYKDALVSFKPFYFFGAVSNLMCLVDKQKRNANSNH